jgi:EmrB/QacA subfamily drug resistance transporter
LAERESRSLTLPIPTKSSMDDRLLQRTTLIVVVLSSFTVPLLLSAPNVAVPAISSTLGADAVAVGWVSTAYLLSSAVFLLPFGRLADMHGRRKIYLAGLLVAMVGSILCALSPNFQSLIGARFLQGIGTGMVYATALALITSVYPRERRGHAIGVTTSAVYFGLTAGPLIGGWITYQFGWRGVFVFPLPLLLASLVLGLTRLKGDWSGAAGERFDLPGTMIYSLSIMALMGGVSKLPATLGWLGTLGGLAGVVGFVSFERRRDHPVFDVTLFFTNRVFTFSCSAALLMYTATFANTFLMSLFLQFLKGMNARNAGLVMMAQPIMQALVSPYAGRLSDRVQPRVLASSGMGLTALGLLMLASAKPDSSLAFVIFGLFVAGTGFALFSAPNMSAIMGSVQPRLLGSAGSTVATVRVLGQMLSMGVITLITAFVMGRVAIQPENYASLARAIQVSFVVAACLCLAGAGLSLARGRVRR